MPEISNPNAAGGRKPSIVAITILGLLILMFSVYFLHAKPGMPENNGHLQTTAQPEAAPSQFGWTAVIAMPLYQALRFVYQRGTGNWGWAIIVLTAIFNLVMFWPRMMALHSSVKMARLQPKVDEIKQRYAVLKNDDPKRTAMNAELMELFSREGASMYAGCLPVLLQMPLFFAYYRVLQHAPSCTRRIGFGLPIYPRRIPLHILPVFIVVTMCITQLITPSAGMDAGQQRLFAFVMPVAMGFTLWHYVSGLALYWAAGNLINLVLQFGINRSRIGREMQSLTAGRTLRTR